MKYSAGIRIAIVMIATGVLAEQVFAESSPPSIDGAIRRADYDAALELIQAALATTPDDPGLRFQQARVRSYIGEQQTALQELDRLRHEYPDNVDYALARSLVLSRLGRDSDALQELRVASTMAPDYEDVWRIRYSLLLRQDDSTAALERQQVVDEAATRFPDSSWWRRTGAENRVRPWTLLVGAGVDRLSDGFPDWDQQFFEVGYEPESGIRYFLGAARHSRFKRADIMFRTGTDFSLQSGWIAGADINFSRNPAFLPEMHYGAHLGRSIGDGWVVDIRYQRREYTTTSVTSVNGSVEKYVGDFRLAYGLGISRLPGNPAIANHGLSANWYYSSRSSIGATISSGKEAESIGGGRVLESDVRGLSIAGRREINERIGLQWWLGLHDQGDFYRRRYFGLAFSIRI